jgi:TonB family protein
MRNCIGITIGCIAVMLASGASAQRSDSAQCRALLSRAARDSVVVTVGLTTRAFDTTTRFRDQDRADLAAAIRQVLRLPTPLPIFVYSEHSLGKRQSGRDSSTVIPTISGAYAVELLPDGHLSNGRVVGGARIEAFDTAFLDALRTVSDSGLLPPRPDGRHSPIELRLSVNPLDVPTIAHATAKRPSVAAEPLFFMRVPALGEGQAVAPMPGNAAPRYPEVARRAKVEGRVRLRFVVDSDGRGDATSIQVEEATALEFVSAVLDAFPALRFAPPGTPRMSAGVDCRDAIRVSVAALSKHWIALRLNER